MELKQTSKLSRCPLYKLLIVPYGIETKFNGVNFLRPDLLIVPYGIETRSRV